MFEIIAERRILWDKRSSLPSLIQAQMSLRFVYGEGYGGSRGPSEKRKLEEKKKKKKIKTKTK